MGREYHIRWTRVCLSGHAHQISAINPRFKACSLWSPPNTFRIPLLFFRILVWYYSGTVDFIAYIALILYYTKATYLYLLKYASCSEADSSYFLDQKKRDHSRWYTGFSSAKRTFISIRRQPILVLTGQTFEMWPGRHLFQHC